MTILVAGSAAMFDLIFAADRHPGSSEVAVLYPNPSASGEWLPGGAAMTIALALRHQGLPAALWHPLPAEGSHEATLTMLRQAGVDLSRSPRVSDEPARCVMVYDGQRRSSWSTRLLSVRPYDVEAILADVTHLIIAPVWGEWTEILLAAAERRGIAASLVGEPALEARRHRWHTVIVDERQFETLGTLAASTLVVTRGEEGAVIRQNSAEIPIAAVKANVVDTTGAGDTFGGTFLARTLQGDSNADAGRIAAEIAARACEGWGSWAAFVTEPAVDAPPTFEERVRGALWGTACGDAFGMPNSFLPAPPWRMTMQPGPADSPYHAGYPAGRITDDTEQALALTDALEDGFGPATVAARLNEWFVGVGGENSLAVGPSTKRALMAYQAGAPVEEIGKFGVTNGAAMRIAPIGVFGALAGLSLERLTDIVTTACLPTHNTSPAISGANALAAAIAAAIAGKDWDHVMEQALEGARIGQRRGNWIYSADVASRIEHGRRLAAGARSKVELVRLISDIVGAGEPTTESVPAAIAIADYAKGDPRVAIEIAGNLRGDTDTIAAMAGAICGAYAGEGAIPAEWRQTVAEVNALDVDRWAERLAAAARTHIQTSNKDVA
ncbi:PfkB family carbohydrate kinase [Kaistia dalseonensis]|uniref:ADP-ribosylglycohydrolase/sugar/nucleoside kinase (Ribokinase family) n=1 Tax=Kaistia dalseonensis TaxID=410840 RepID=A0ABU0H529_9HYPH|nr:PfkB family carbohydrate kinase [Kaistia dalseonensis]MCX5494009.1 PfkB family carbohydrate kinase [Kaistia dalseonensis]MDQ0436586.1 ADP-ribosylglycohydrolase/sugar/nucleoside kinase (ribokinase family) [Kaistia dalseonensis]